MCFNTALFYFVYDEVSQSVARQLKCMHLLFPTYFKTWRPSPLNHSHNSRLSTNAYITYNKIT